MFGWPAAASLPIVCITLVDNGSGDGSIDFVARNYHEVEIVALPRNLGFSAANNIALRGVKTEYVALVNKHHPLWIKSLIEALGCHLEAGYAASKMLFYDRPRIIDHAGDAYTRAGPAFCVAGLSQRGVIICRMDFGGLFGSGCE